MDISDLSAEYPDLDLETLALRVKAGAYELDERYPRWEQEIEVSELNMYSISSCILGQLYNDFWQARYDLGFCGPDDPFDVSRKRYSQWANEKGFNLYEDPHFSPAVVGRPGIWAALGKLWAQVIGERRAER